MTLLLNFLLPIASLLIAVIGYRLYKKSDNKLSTLLYTAATMLVVAITYSAIQPAYIPKNAAPRMAKVPIEQPTEAVIENRMLVPKDRTNSVSEILTIREEVKEVLEDK